MAVIQTQAGIGALRAGGTETRGGGGPLRLDLRFAGHRGRVHRILLLFLVE